MRRREFSGLSPSTQAEKKKREPSSSAKLAAAGAFGAVAAPAAVRAQTAFNPGK